MSEEEDKTSIISGIIGSYNLDSDGPMSGSVFVPTNDLYLGQLKLPKYYQWSPKEDITAYELACCVPVLVIINSGAVEYAVNGLPEEAKRHFKLV